ncbi:Zn-dependent protease with chaperone function [Scopulibacillus darangshiensis]|uniref:Zn-dependent protease with chaperone function n=1 Tax=Scopulibacillus darangshiensis TaxID=442528 RepID=A0A4R2P623_9BACL|nr:M48 family metallopeptidase [Scopulibacillus darangshiensis]TCP29235.1 Zn-dependent protease with chaperone function [Scopulibacillus darangshiensis]
MKKVAWWFLGLYVVYIIGMILYFFVWTDPGVPANVKGTAADPALFMTHKQTILSQDYSRIQDLIYFLTMPLDWGIYIFILVFGFSRWLRNRSEEVSRFSLLHTAVYFLALSVLTWVISFPINLVSHKISLHYGISVQSFPSWLKDDITGFWVNWIIMFVTVAVIYFFIRKNPRRWWLPVWLLSIPFVIFMTYIQPVVIDPLYNDFYTLKDSTLKHEILHLADKANIPADNVYEVDMSKKTNALNAYVNGVGSNLRIVLYDTTVHRLDDREVLFVMAHEMGHYVKHHLLWGVAGSIVMALVGLFITAKILIWATSRWGGRLGIRHPGDIASLPVLLLIISLLSFIGSPIENAVSRHYEHEADKYAISLTHDKEAGISSFQKLTVAGLSDVNPPALVKFFMYGHPTMLERIQFIEGYKGKK